MTEIDPFAHLKVGTFQHWEVFANPNQQYLGRCVIWCRRAAASDLTEAAAAEQADLHTTLNAVKEACTALFQPDWFNYAFLGNETPHLHAHFIPRYREPKVFLGHTFADMHFGKNYRSDHGFKTPDTVLKAVIEGYRKRLPA